MKKLLLGFIFLCAHAQASELTQISCSGINPGTGGSIHFFGPEVKTFTTETCIERNPGYDNECSMNPGPYDDVDECPCIESRTDTYEYKVWHAKGSIFTEDIIIPLDLEFDQYSDSPRFSATQSGIEKENKYTANFWSQNGFDIEDESLTIALMYGPEAVGYKDLIQERLLCEW